MSKFQDPRHRQRWEIEMDERYARFRATSQRFEAVLDRNIRQGRPMTKLSAIADRIRLKKLAHDKVADDWAKRLDELDKREPEAFAAGHAVLAERETDLAGMESDLRALSNNGPLSGSSSEILKNST
jgi:hypothetical protein